jgi:Gpi18-like mannosyltransferase
MLVWCGIAFAFKLQAVFIAPFALAMLIAHRTPWRLWPIPAGIYIGAMLPAWLAGWPAADLATIYLRQAGFYDQLAMNAPNLWQIVQTLAGPAPLEPIAFAAAALIMLVFLVRFARAGAMPDPVAAALLSALILPGLLPRMHDRYFFLADLLAFALAASWRSRDGWLIFAGVQTGSLLALWSGMSGDPAFAAAGGVAMIAATGALMLRLRPHPARTLTPAFGEGCARR